MSVEVALVPLMMGIITAVRASRAANQRARDQAWDAQRQGVDAAATSAAQGRRSAAEELAAQAWAVRGQDIRPTAVPGHQAAPPAVVQHVPTRIRNRPLLVTALADVGARVTQDADCVTATWQDVRADFRADRSGVWNASFTGRVGQGRADEIADALDRAYGLRVQDAVLRRLRQHAGSAGLAIESETVEDDGAVALVLQAVNL
ncbi:MAG: hypothetical protein LBD97_03140 [Bifidobacteriaceae bacterium]|jgi:hypothetical protein|nr:hypothetical protein [Bifidobacteriaceae bacterium]